MAASDVVLVAVQAQQPAGGPGAFPLHQVAAGLIVLCAIGVAAKAHRWFRKRAQHDDDPRGGLVTGWDRRLSTSKAMALAWTAALAHMIITLGLIGVTAGRERFNEAFAAQADGSSPLELYLVLIGGPYAALVLSKLTVVTKIASGGLQKTDGRGDGNIADLVSGDDGAADLPDFQYTLFNLIGLGVVLVLFGADPASGVPEVPSFLAVLLGGSALTYTANKAVQGNAPKITGVVPGMARIGERIAILGLNLHLASAEEDKPKVTVAGVEVDKSKISAVRSDRVEFEVPAPKAGTGWDSRPQDVRLTTVAGATADAPAAVTIVEDQPLLTAVQPQMISLGELLTLSGNYFYKAGDCNEDGKPKDEATAPVAHIEWDEAGSRRRHDVAVLTDPAPTNTVLALAIPPSIVPAQLLPLDVGLSLRRDGKRSQEIALPLRLSAVPRVTQMRPLRARPGQIVTLTGDALALHPDVSRAVVSVAGKVAEITRQDKDGRTVGFKVPPTVIGPCNVALSKPPHAAVTLPERLQVDKDKPELLATPASTQVSHPLRLDGRYFLPVDPAEDAALQVHLTWTNQSGVSEHVKLDPDPDPAPTDDRLHVTIPADLQPRVVTEVQAQVHVTRRDLASEPAKLRLLPVS